MRFQRLPSTGVHRPQTIARGQQPPSGSKIVDVEQFVDRQPSPSALRSPDAHIPVVDTVLDRPRRSPRLKHHAALESESQGRAAGREVRARFAVAAGRSVDLDEVAVLQAWKLTKVVHPRPEAAAAEAGHVAAPGLLDRRIRRTSNEDEVALRRLQSSA